MTTSIRESAATLGAFQGYAYGYPHKTAYRPLDPVVPLKEAWAAEDKTSLFLYLHVPFCEVRCGFCNLFTTTGAGNSYVEQYLAALDRQADAVLEALGKEARFARLAVGGGTPTFLTVSELERLFEICDRISRGGTRVRSDLLPGSIEASPQTLNRDKLALMKSRGLTRVSIGVQSFLESETRSLGRPQDPVMVRQTLGMLAESAFHCANVDLIYGIAGQTVATWRRSLADALEFAPQELYLYPLYVRPLTGLDRIGRSASDNRLELYRVGRDFLLERGYRQISMRLFRAGHYAPPEGPVYCCQEDGMVGLGAGARSYTSHLHYSTEYAVRRSGVQAIIDDFVRRTATQFAYADYGCALGRQEQVRRYVLKSLLRVEGLNLASFTAQFGGHPYSQLPQLKQLEEESLAGSDGGFLRLTPEGIELSDVIGPWLCSPGMRQRMETFVLA